MKARIDAILHREQAEYLDTLLPAGDDLLAEMEKYASEHKTPIADREVALFLEITARSMGARRVLEIGMAIGYSVIHLARGMSDDSQIVTIEPADEMIRAAEKFIETAGYTERVRIERGRALDVLPRLDGTFDLVFIDALKEEYGDYLELALPLLRAGGVVIVDNLLWGGQVATVARNEKQKNSTEALRKFNRRFVNHPQLRAVVLPVGDGLGYGIKL
ncbi:MAG: O-methyltransferase [Pyrinomonadaceae bacterium]|nr:O-methyltransferase [Pyrinomonadaceae bacterium]